jgi:hypothetical protein
MQQVLSEMADSLEMGMLQTLGGCLDAESEHLQQTSLQLGLQTPSAYHYACASRGSPE